MLTCAVASDCDTACVATKVADVSMRPLQCQPLIPETKVTYRAVLVGGSLFLQFPACEETEEIESVGRHHHDALARGLGEKCGQIVSIGSSELEEATVCGRGEVQGKACRYHHTYECRRTQANPCLVSCQQESKRWSAGSLHPNSPHRTDY